MASQQKTGSLSKGTIALFAIALALLLIGGAGTARAALVYVSDSYTAQVNLPDIGVTLVENTDNQGWHGVSSRDYDNAANQWSATDGELLKGLPAVNVLGKSYDEQIAVKNSGNIDEYVRVKLTKYWVDPNGNKVTTILPDSVKMPDLIKTNAPATGAWVKDPKSETAESAVYYYTAVLSSGAQTSDLMSSLKIDSKIVDYVTPESIEAGVPEYTFNGYKFMLEAEVEAVQTHNAQKAIKSAWGVDVNVGSNGSLSLA